MKFNRGHHRFAVFTACCTFVMIMAGALVTSNDAGLSVPDWPTSFGSFYRIPPMVGGVLFEHGHRMIGEFIGILTIFLAVWTQRAEKHRPWMRMLGWFALGTVIAQGILGGLTVLLNLPPVVSTAHATLGQTFFCVVVSIALFTSRRWTEESDQRIENSNSSLPTLAATTVGVVWAQLILGAAFRHNGLRVIPHLIGAVIVTVMVATLVTRTLRQYRNISALRVPAIVLASLLGLQLTLGFAAYFTRLVWTQGAVEPLAPLVIATVSHVAVGALVLATTLILAIESRRYLRTCTNSSVLSPQPQSTQKVTA